MVGRVYCGSGRLTMSVLTTGDDTRPAYLRGRYLVAELVHFSKQYSGLSINDARWSCISLNQETYRALSYVYLYHRYFSRVNIYRSYSLLTKDARIDVWLLQSHPQMESQPASAQLARQYSLCGSYFPALLPRLLHFGHPLYHTLPSSRRPDYMRLF